LSRFRKEKRIGRRRRLKEELEKTKKELMNKENNWEKERRFLTEESEKTRKDLRNKENYCDNLGRRLEEELENARKELEKTKKEIWNNINGRRKEVN